MIWRFTILNNRTSVSTVIDEPTGWDANTSEIKRDLDWHGIFFTSQGETFQFDGVAMRLIKSEYETYGVQADMTLIMEEDCGNGFEEFSRGKFMFKNYEFVCGIECYVKVPIETTTEVKSLRNRINQKVDLERNLSFDGVELAGYSKLPFEMQLPSKGVLLRNQSLNTNNNATPCDIPVNVYAQIIEIGLDTNKSSEIGSFLFNSQPIFQTTTSYITGSSVYTFYGVHCPCDYVNSILNFDKQFINVNETKGRPLTVNYTISGRMTSNNIPISALDFVFFKRSSLDVYTTFDHRSLGVQVGGKILEIGDYLDFNISLSTTIVLDEGDRLYMCMPTDVYVGYPNPYIENAFTIEFDVSSFFYMEGLSITSPTISKVFAVNESLSRIVESITNNNLKVYSEYFGRTDSQPYNHSEDGIGGLEVITNGLRIRRQENKVGETNKFSISLQDMWEGLNPIHNIGMGLEPDTNRPGYNCLRVEDWKYFYNDVPLLTCDNVDKISRKTNEREIFSTFQFGYAKWEAEEYTGLDEFLTKRTYRTTINAIKNDFIKLSKFVGSGYALEITRRKGDDSKDWRYDKETFIICCTRKSDTVINLDFTDSNSFNIVNASPFIYAGGSIIVSGTLYNNGTFNIVAVTYAGSYYIVDVVQSTFTEVVDANVTNSAVSVISVELGNITTPENIIDPDTIYNFRISPVRNAMRWMKKVLASYRQFNGDSKIVFTDGDANYFAKGEMTNSVGKLEAAAVREDQIIDPNLFADMLNAMPFLIPERVVFDYPLTSREYKILMENPYGTIYFSSGGNTSTSDKIISESNQFMLAEYGANLIPEDAKYSSNNNGGCEEGYGWIDTIVYKPDKGIATFNLIPKQI